jgi:hypothetical protein
MRKICLLLLCAWAAASSADDAAQTPAAPIAIPASAAPTARPRQAAPAPARSAPGDPPPAAEAPKFVSEAKWGLAGYNNNEIYYTVFVTNQDTRIIRCITEISGYYLENGHKLGISDRQLTTVFPNQPTQVGIWMDMDKDSGATYAVKCHPL